MDNMIDIGNNNANSSSTGIVEKATGSNLPEGPL